MGASGLMERAAESSGVGADARIDADRNRNNLPRQLTSFVGRAADIDSIRRALATTRLLTLTGPGGVGKTRLALQAAGQEVDDRGDRVWFLDLASVHEAALVPPLVATTLGVRESPNEPLITTLTRRLRTLKMLLIMDNCEHLLQSCGELVDVLLRMCPDVRIICTSRERLNVSGEVVWLVAGLSVTAADGIRGALPHLPDAVNLFVERARAADRTFDLTDESATAVAELCTRLDGLPLAIELAAARSNAFSPRQIAERLETRFELLSTSGRTAPARQRTLQATLDWSYVLMAPAEQQVFECLSVFAGGFTLDAAEAVCIVDEPGRATADLLGHLVDKSLVLAEERKRERRYRLLDTILAYGRKHLAEKPGLLLEAECRHTRYFVALAERAESQLRGPRQVQWIERLQLEQDNLRGTLQRCLERGDTESALRLGSALWYFWQVRGQVREGRDWLERAIVQAGPDPTLQLAKALRAAGALCGRLGNHRRARAHFSEALAIFERFGDPAGTVATLNNLAVLATESGDYQDAESILQRCLNLSRAPHDVHVPVVLGNLGWVAEARAEFAQALRWHKEALAIWRDMNDREGMATSLIWQAGVLQCMGELDSATALVEEGLMLARGADAKPPITRGLRTLGAIAVDRKQLARAEVLLSESLQLALESDLELDASACLIWHADVAIQSGEHARAARCLAASDHLRSTGRWVRHAREETHYQQCLTAVRENLSNEAFQAAWTAGPAMPPERLLGKSAALPSAGTLDTRARQQDGLTAREMEVARLVAHGLSNREIATDLVIAVSTAERHVANILRKLDLSSRTQIAAWFLQESRQA